MSQIFTYLSNSVIGDYFKLTCGESRILTFGFLFSFLSSFGQTFFISLFVPDFLDALALSKSGFGTLYSALTLASAGLIPLVGGWIDRVSLRTYSLWVLSGLIAGALITAFSWHVAVLIPGLFLLRLAGQGLSTHTAKTSIARHYEHRRGKSLSVINLGLPLGEGSLPLLVTGVLALISWRTTWIFIGLAILLIVLPLQMILLSLSELQANDPPQTKLTTQSGDATKQPFSGVYLSLLKDRQFWLLLPAVILPGFWITGLFLYQSTLAKQSGWTLGILAGGFVGYAIARVTFSLGIGPVIDRLGSRVLFPFYLVPFGMALLISYTHPGNWSAYLYMALLGVTMGMGSTIKTALWAELYGMELIGRARSLFSSLSVFSTSASPLLMGWWLDAGISIHRILLWAFVTFLLSMGAAFWGVRLSPSVHSDVSTDKTTTE